MIDRAFAAVRERVAKADPGLALTALRVCGELRHKLKGKTRSRAFMHVGHHPGSICLHPAAGKLKVNHVVGLFLHEFGHLGTPDGSEADADQWVLVKLGIAILYKGPLCLEWVPDDVVAGLLGASANPMTPGELKQGARTAMARRSVSVPMALLSKKGLLVGRTLDYGCGRGQDADHFKMAKYDPTWFPVKPAGPFDTITSNYVLNVTPPRVEAEILADIRSLLTPGGIAYITVRRDVHADGVTKSGTYQRIVKLDLPVLVEKKGAFATYVMRA